MSIVTISLEDKLLTFYKRITMKHIKSSLGLLALFYQLSVFSIVPFIQPRSQSEDSSRELVGWTRYINQFDTDVFYGSWATTLEYSQTTSPFDIGRNLFGYSLIDDTTPFVHITGSQVGDRDPFDWLADYFGLPTDFESKLMFKPRVQNIVADFDFYFGLDNILNGLYFRFHAPLVHTKWNLHFSEDVINPGVNGYDAGYFGPTAVPRNQLLNRFTDFASGLIPNLNAPITFVPLANAKISTHALPKTRLAEIQAAFGWNFLQSEGHHFGLNLRTAIPTGNKPEGIYLFEPMVGNGKHWELGLGLTCHYLLFTDCKCRSVAFYCDANVTYMFWNLQRRTFDLVNKPLSRYMLLEQLGTPVTNLFINAAQGTAAGSVAPPLQFQNRFVPVANFTTFDVEVDVTAHVDATAMLNFRVGNWDIDVGYNYWNRLCEHISPRCTCTLPFNNDQTYALKGDARVYGFVANDAGSSPVPPGTPIPLSATESRATIHTGTNRPIGQVVSAAQNQNPGIDGGVNQWAMVTETDDTDQIVVFPGQDGGADTQQRSSLAPVVVVPGNLDFEAAETKGLSNRLFAHVSYNFEDWCGCYTPFVGMGGFIELAHHSSDECQSPDFDNSCQSVGFSQWGIWLKGGIGF